MAKINTHYQDLRRAYIFPIIESKLDTLKASHPDVSVLNFGVGDISKPLAPAIVTAICQATEEMGREHAIKGYGPSDGYRFLKEAILKAQYADLGIEADEIFISDGTNSDASNIQEIFSHDSVIGIPDPTYPVYLDVNIMAGRGARVHLLPCTLETGFVPKPPKQHCDVIYLCTPSNPTGVAMNRAQLKEWVDYAKAEGAILIIDNAYEAFISSPDVPRSIFEIEGAKEVAIEFRSFSKSAGFTGLRCAYSVLPKSVLAFAGESAVPLHNLWARRLSTKSNGIAYPIQRGAEATLTGVGKQQTQAQIDDYLKQAKTLAEGLRSMGQHCYGGTDSPYIWWKTPEAQTSWQFFDFLLEKCHLISIPGVGFGAHGEGYVRLSAFTNETMAQEALRRIQRCVT